MKAFIGLVIGALVAFLLASIFVGIYLAFSASILLGIIVLFAEPASLIIGLVYILTGTDIAQKLIEFFFN